MTAAGRRPSWSLADLFEMGEATLALIGAQRAGLLDVLWEAAATPAELARSLGLDQRATRLLLNVLLAAGAVSRRGDAFSASPELQALRLTSPGGVSLDLELLGHLEAFLRTGAPLVRMDGTDEERGRLFATVADRLAPPFGPTARALAERVPAGLTDVLDVGAGSGVWSLALADRWPAVRVRAIDLPPVARVFLRHARQRGLADRVSAVAASYHEIEWPAVDCVILANVLHLEPPAAAERLVRRAAAALRPGGVLLLVDVLGAADYEERWDRASYALFLAMRTAAGRVHPRHRVEEWLRDGGLGPPVDLALSGLVDVVLVPAPVEPR